MLNEIDPSRVLLFAQEAAEGAAPSGGGGWLVLEYGIVLVFLGAALFAICRTSRRN